MRKNSKTSRIGNIWSSDEIRFLKEHYSDLRFKAIADSLKRNYRGVKVKAQKLHLYHQKLKGNQPIQNLPETDKAYLAAFIDGEGCIGFTITWKNNVPLHAVPVVSVSNSNGEVIRWIARRGQWPVARTKTFYKSAENRYIQPRDCYRLFISGRARVESFLRAIFPYLQIKKKLAQKIFKFYRQREKNLQKSFSIQDWKLVLEVKELVDSHKAPHIRSRQRLAQFIKELERKESNQ